MKILLSERGEITAGEILALTRSGGARRENVESAIANGSTRTLIARRGERIEGAVAWAHLPWDSEIFAFPAGRLEFMIATESGPAAYDRLCRALVDDAQASGIRHLTARMSSADIQGIQALERAGFETIDAIQTFSIELEGQRYLEGPTARLVRAYAPADLEPLCEIARTAYVHDRFHADSALAPGVADRAHEQWVRNSCLGKAADHVVVTEWDGRVAGYVTCRLARSVNFGASGTILLVATANFARGKGLARAATLGSLDWFRAQGARQVDVGTQFRNIAAGRLYESCGFRLSATSVTLRKTL